MKRRDFIKDSLAASLILSSGMIYSCMDGSKKLKVLVLGGTNFVGPAIVNAAMNNGHEVTLFNRGITNPGLFPNLKLIKGDRNNGLSAYEDLLNERWDVIIDVWPEKANLVDEATKALASQTDHYIYISSIAVYNDFQEVGLNEESEVVSLERPKEEWYYSEEKLAAENFVRERFQDNHTILRPGPIKGWRDPALDLFYWCKKLKEDDEIIAPGSGQDPLQFIDVNDVGRFSITAFENKLIGSFNIVGPGSDVLLWIDFLNSTKNHLQSETKLIWADEAFLRENEVASFSDLPLWAPLSEDRGFMQISNNKLVQTGFEFTPMETTLEDCLKWHEDKMNENLQFGTDEVGLGLSKNRESDLLEKLKMIESGI